MATSVKLYPGQRGTKRWVQKYGDQLICVRYRYDPVKHTRTTTVELAVDEALWIAGTTVVGVRVAWGEATIARQIKAAGGRWNRQQLVWELPYRQVIALNLLDRMVWLTV